MPDVLLIQPPIKDFYLTKKRTQPYGLLSLAASLIKSGFSTEVLDGLASPKVRNIDLPANMLYLREFYPNVDLSPFALFYGFKHFGYSFQHIGTVARDSRAFLVGISSLFTAYAAEALQTAAIVKKFHPGCKIVVGGHHPTQLPESVISHPSVDFILRGEAEESLPLLARSLQDGSELEKIPGIGFQKNEQPFIADPVIVKELENLPIPALGLAKNKFYQRSGKASMIISTSRGCPMKCTYCSVGASSSIPYRRRSLTAVLAEIDAALANHDVRFIDFEDENLSLNRSWFMDLLDELRLRFRNKSVELRAMNGLLPSTLDKNVIAAMKQAGFRSLNLSLCSISTEQLNAYQRPDTKQAFDTALKDAERLGMDAVGYIIIGGPGQTAKQSVSDLLFLASRRVLAGVSVFYPAPGSLEYERSEQLGLLPDDYSLMRSTTIPISHTTSRLETVTLLRLGRILNYLKRPTMRSTLDSGLALKTPPGQSHVPIDIGQELFDHFLNTGEIIGIASDGKRYKHAVSQILIQQFIAGLQNLIVKANH